VFQHKVKHTRCVLQVAPVLRTDVRNQLLALEESGLLAEAVTQFSYAEGGAVARLLSLLDRRLGSGFVRATSARSIDRRVARQVRSHFWADLARLGGTRLSGGRLGPTLNDTCVAAVDRLARSLVGPRVKLTLGEEDACLASFTATRDRGGRCLYDLPIAHYATTKAIMDREEAAFPNASLHYRRAEEYRSTRSRRKDRELAAADHVVVASEFVRSSLLARGVSPSRITVIPYGCQPQSNGLPTASRRDRARTVLYVGHLSLRKGTPRLLRAWRRLGAHRTHQLRLIGSLQLSPQFLSDFTGLFEHVPHLPQRELWEHYRTAYAFVLPSAVEGFAQVINEAISFGLPVIASKNSAAPDFMTHGKEGLLYSFDDEDGLCAALDYLLSHPREAADMGQAAYELAQRWTWPDYRSAFVRLVARLLEELESDSSAVQKTHLASEYPQHQEPGGERPHHGPCRPEESEAVEAALGRHDQDPRAGRPAGERASCLKSG
jgi:glycosyltransferase involved in cell wall biosynthesis